MNFFMNDDELEEIKPITKESEDKAIVITPTVGKRQEEKSDEQKQLVALDALILGPTAASQIHGVPQSSASKYKDGKDIKDPNVRAEVLATRHGIADVATAKLMDTLNLINPSELGTVKNKVMVLNSLSRLVETVTEKNGNGSGQSVHLHLYAPNQKKESDYEVIEA